MSNPLKSPLIKLKSKQTYLKKYGVEHFSQAKIPQKNFQYKQYTYPCGFVTHVQGYEPFALNDLIKEGHTSSCIVTCRSKVPDIWYFDGDGKKHRYFVDIYLPAVNKMIEVKSEYTLNKYKENVLLKANYLKNLKVVLLTINNLFTSRCSPTFSFSICRRLILLSAFGVGFGLIFLLFFFLF